MSSTVSGSLGESPNGSATEVGAGLVVGLNAVIVAVTSGDPRVATVRGGAPSADLGLGEAGPRDALPFGPLDPERDRTLERALRGWVERQAGLELGYVEQLYTFADRDRGPRALPGAPRVLSIAYLALVRESLGEGAGEVVWRSWYGYFPWEDWREGRPAVLDAGLVPRLVAWADAGEDPSARRTRHDRVEITFGLGGAPWDHERVLERYELLYEVGLVEEAHRDRGVEAVIGGTDAPVGARGPHDRSMALDHRRMLATAMGRLRGKLAYRPVVFELLPETFTLSGLQEVVEALAGRRLHKQNFRRLVEAGGLVEGTGRYRTHTGGRPAELFCFRSEVLRERPAPGVRARR